MQRKSRSRPQRITGTEERSGRELSTTGTQGEASVAGGPLDTVSSVDKEEEEQLAAGDPILEPLFKLAPELARTLCASCGQPATIRVGPRGIAAACSAPGCGTRVLIDEREVARLAAHMAVACGVCGAVFEHEMGIDGPHLRCSRCGHSESWNTLRTGLLRERRGRR